MNDQFTRPATAVVLLFSLTGCDESIADHGQFSDESGGLDHGQLVITHESPSDQSNARPVDDEQMNGASPDAEHAPLNFQEFLEANHVIWDGESYIYDNELVFSKEATEAAYDRYLNPPQQRRGNHADPYYYVWNDTEKRNLRYHFSTDMTNNYQGSVLLTDAQVRQAFRVAADYWEAATDVKFIEDPTSPLFTVQTVHEVANWNGRAFYPHSGSNYSLKLNKYLGHSWGNFDDTVELFAHELGHVLGLAHEFQHEDSPNTHGQGYFGTSFGAYDDRSIMHWNRAWFSPSEGDKAAVRYLYGDPSLDYQGENNGWLSFSAGSYTADMVTDRVVAGDFDGDGDDDVAMFYDYWGTTTRAHVLLSTGTSFQGPSTWWIPSSSSYPVSEFSNRVVAGDFDGDGDDDIAMIHEENASTTVARVLRSNRSGFVYEGENGWWRSSGSYTASRVTGRVVSGNFDGDAQGRDDIAMIYDHGGGVTSADLLLSTGSGFIVQTKWWQSNPGSYTASRVTDRVVAADFDGNGKDDIAMVYDYGWGKTGIHVLVSTGTSFVPPTSAGWWSTGYGSYTATQTTGKVVAGKFHGFGNADIAMFYDYGNTGSVQYGPAKTSAIHMLLSTGSNFEFQGDGSGWWRGFYDAQDMSNRVVSGDFNGDGLDDIYALYNWKWFDWQTPSAVSHVFLTSPYYQP